MNHIFCPPLYDFLARNAELSISLASFVVALVALFVAVWEVRSSRHHNRLSVRPELMQYSDAIEDDLVFRLGVENCGLGPARILSCGIEDQSASVGNTPLAVRGHIEHIIGAVSNRVTVELIHPRYVLAQGEKREVLTVELRNITQVQARVIFGRLRKLDVQAKFESLYEEPDELRPSAPDGGGASGTSST